MRRTLLTTTGTTTRRAPRALGATVLAAALLLGACSGVDDPGAGGDGAAASSGTDSASTTAGAGGIDAAGATVDVDALPDPVAEVDGRPVARADFVEIFEQQRAASQQAEAGGALSEAALRDAVLDSLVRSELLDQEGERLGFEASEEDVDAELDTLAEQSGVGSGDELVALLEEQGVSEDQLREEAARLLLVDRVLQERGAVEEPSEEDLRAYYEELAAGPDGAAATEGTEGLPDFEDIKDVLADQLRQERENEAISTVVEELEKDAEITRHL